MKDSAERQAIIGRFFDMEPKAMATSRNLRVKFGDGSDRQALPAAERIVAKSRPIVMMTLKN